MQKIRAFFCKRLNVEAPIDYSSFFSWILWDPNREAFTIPFLDLSIMWYGILFALGFIVGFFLFIPLFKEYLSKKNQLFPRDISNWPQFAQSLQSQKTSPFKLSKQTLHDLALQSQTTEYSPALKQALLEAANTQLKDPAFHLNRKAMQDLFPEAMVKVSTLSQAFADRMIWFIVIGTVIGARLGHVLFYDWPYYQANPLEILMIRKGGLASHGGSLGVLIGLFLFMRVQRKQYPDVSLLNLMDLVAIPTAFAVACIRLGNFFNQEITGIPSNMPWAIIFGHPAEGGAVVPRHPAQLYEAGAYLITFGILYGLWKKQGSTLKPGTISGLFFILIFGSRFFIEFLKSPFTDISEPYWFQIGQHLSFPFIILGIALMCLPKRFTTPYQSLK